MKDTPTIRPAKLADLEDLISFAEEAGFGITSLPRNPALLENRLQEAESAFQGIALEIPRETYLFIMELDGKPIGVSGIISRIGSVEPFYAYHVVPIEQKSKVLNFEETIHALHFIRAREKPTEIGTLFLKKSFRKKEWGRLLSFSRFLFVAAFREHFADTVLAELRGVSDHVGNSPFWQAIGEKFFHCSFKEADYLRTAHPECINELFPRYPIYPLLLPKEARDVIGQLHPDTIGAYRLLEKQGFQKSDYIDIFDGGPHVYAPTDEIKTIAESRVIAAKLGQVDEGRLAIVSNDRLDFRACLAELMINEDNITLSPDIGFQLNIEDGEIVRYFILGDR